ncbi:hypothetical protein [Bacillus solimangrovi]|uniref:Peptidyl-prolyl cis-trans isomerase n=1 Tax=Bacillus solimangrovi TaxID=1305675 RepID=A0A1E5LIK2_9BACI|nr:hypothetical protein [Bacillus solimangrovi]OEH93907.1 hypothetical protein BFG57_10580 [Bacillus solimangrovi]
MENILLLTGKVKFPLTIDPGVWIFDDRKIELDKAFNSTDHVGEDLDDYTKKMSQNWDRELVSQVANPPVTKTTKKFEKEKIMTSTFAMPFAPFIDNAEPETHATKLVIETSDGEHIIMPIEEGMKAMLCFSIDGRPLQDDGPVHFYYGDGSNRERPIKYVKKFIIQ